MGKNDLWIASTANVANATLLTIDTDFDHLDGKYVTVKKYEQNLYSITINEAPCQHVSCRSCLLTSLGYDIMPEILAKFDRTKVEQETN